MRVMEQLCDDCESPLLFAGEVVGTLRVTSGVKHGCAMSGIGVALCIDTSLRRLPVRSLVDLVRLMACADDPAMIFAKVWRDLPPAAGDFARWAAASGPTLSARKCVFVPPWGASRTPRSRFLPGLGRVCVVKAGAGGPPGWSSCRGQWKGVAANLLRRTRVIISAGGTRIIQHRFDGVSMARFCAQCTSPDAHILKAHCQASQRLCAAP